MMPSVAQNKLAMLEAPLAQKPDNALPDIIRETGAGQLQDLTVELRAEIKEYKSLKTAKSDLHNCLVANRHLRLVLC